MRRPVVRLIAAKELRDLVRDRRTVLLILVLPALVWLLFGVSGTLFALSLDKPTVVAVIGGGDLPTGGAWPALIQGEGFAAEFDAVKEAGGELVARPMTGDPAELLQSRRADAVLIVSPGLAADLDRRDAKPTVKILQREGDAKSKATAKRLAAAVRAWEDKLRRVRFERAGLPPDFDRVLTIEDPQADKPKEKKVADELRDTFSRAFPFILVMWLVAGAIQPAVDMTAGEKERGTMETLLISPAERAEIVAGKFLATTAFAFASVVWNVLWLTGAAVALQVFLGFPVISLPGVVGCVVLAVPVAMLFSAVCIALGVFAKSTKEGQYYLIPLILVTMPLAFWSMLPGVELNPGTCWVPVTGPMLLQARLLSVGPDPIPWEYFPPVLAASALWVGLALWLAVRQFKSESVLFRETAPGPANPFARLFRRKPKPADP